MNTVIHLTSDDPDDWGHAVRSANMLASNEWLAHDDLTLLAHRTGARIVAPDSTHADEVRDLLDRGVTVTVGESCLDSLNVRHGTIDGVETVSSGVTELVRLQSAGYNYVKIP
ncbi:DsrE family protein [Halobaculum marinum]|uniref:DsrE family protein n=1 Tax=Halobaculum marinum TaxID=3031996 RepID=A0ABD5WVB1_9EURY|nr:DsrE family protein [Halobaculum sp. DT55]